MWTNRTGDCETRALCVPPVSWYTVQLVIYFINQVTDKSADRGPACDIRLPWDNQARLRIDRVEIEMWYSICMVNWSMLIKIWLNIFERLLCLMLIKLNYNWSDIVNIKRGTIIYNRLLLFLLFTRYVFASFKISI